MPPDQTIASGTVPPAARAPHAPGMVTDPSESDLARRLQSGGLLAFTRSTRIVLADGERETWIQVSKLGEWMGHHNGPFELTQAHHDSAIAAFDATENDLVLDYEHQSCAFIPTEAPAAGWISELRTEGDALLARTKFTERAAAAIRADEYRYTSPVWFFDVPDRVSGEPVLAELHSVALTNVPFLDGMAPVALSRFGLTQHQRTTTMADKPETETEDETQAGERKNATPAGDQAIAKLLQILGLETEEDLAAWVDMHAEDLPKVSEEPAEGGEGDGSSVAATRSALALALARNEELAAGLAELRQVEGARAVELAIKEGRAPASQRADLLALATSATKADRDLFVRLTKTTIAVPIVDKITGPAGTGAGDDERDLSPREQAFFNALSRSKPRGKDGKALTKKELRALAREKAAAKSVGAEN